MRAGRMDRIVTLYENDGGGVLAPGSDDGVECYE